MSRQDDRIRELKSMACNRCFTNNMSNHNPNCLNAEYDFDRFDGRRYLTVPERRELERLEGRYPGYY